jgi:hypothetical protein
MFQLSFVVTQMVSKQRVRFISMKLAIKAPLTRTTGRTLLMYFTYFSIIARSLFVSWFLKLN